LTHHVPPFKVTRGSVLETETNVEAPKFEAEAKAVAFKTEAKTEAVDHKTEAKAARQLVGPDQHNIEAYVISETIAGLLPDRQYANKRALEQ